MSAKILALSFVAVGILYALPSGAQAQTCTLGPYTSATSLAAIDAAIDGAGNSAVVCLRRGSSWTTSSTALSFTTGHPDASRVLVCASDATKCTARVSDDNPRITTTNTDSRVMSFGDNGDGYTIRDIDFYNSTKQGAQAVESIDGANRDITIEGGIYDGWLKFADFGFGLPENIKLGICGNVTEFRNAYHTGDQHIMYGACKNCGFSIYVHHWGDPSPNSGRTHELDFSTWDTAVESSNITVECSHFVTDSANVDGNGYIIKAAYGSNLTVRDSIFEATLGEPVSAANCAGGVNFGGHTASGGRPYHWNGAQIYRNVFAMKNCYGVQSAIGADINVYNNLFVNDWKPGDAYAFTASLVITGTGCADVPQICQTADRIAFYNNTVFVNEASSGGVGNGNTPFDASVGTGHSFYNNVIVDMAQDAPGEANIIDLGGCDHWGAGGSRIFNNYVHTPNDPNPTVAWNSCSGASGNVTSSSASPGLANPTNVSMSYLDRMKLLPGAAVAGRGRAGAPVEDFLRIVRGSPPSIGALEFGSATATTLAPPVLLAP